MAEQGLDHARVGSAFQQVSGEAVPQHMRADALSHAAALPSLAADSLHRAGGEMILRFPGRKEPVSGGTHDPEVGLENGQQGGRQHGVTILGAFALLHAQQHALAVHVGDLERDGFGDAQSGTIAGQQDDAILEPVDVREEVLDFFWGEDHGKRFGHAGARKVLLPPGHLQRGQVEELHGGNESVDALRRELAHLRKIKLVLADGFQVQLVRTAVEVFGVPGDIMDVAALGSAREIAKAHVFDHALP
jgi:hypothetical protein